MTEEPQEEKPVKPMPPLERAASGGWLYRGGVPGNRGNHVTKKAKRDAERLLEASAKRLVLELQTLDIKEIAKLYPALLKYFLGQKIIIESVSAERLGEVSEVLAGYFVGREQEFEECFNRLVSILLPQSSEHVSGDSEEPEDE